MGHIHEKYDFVVSLFVVHNGRVLFAHHPRYNWWAPVGGHIDLDEDPDQAIFREIKEETGLDIEILSEKADVAPDAGTKLLYRPNYMDVYEANPPHKHISLIYFANAKSEIVTKSDEHIELKWLTQDEFNAPLYNLSSSLKFYATKAVESAQKRQVND